VRDLYRYRDLIGALVARDLKVRYRRSAIGFLWTMLHPLMMMVVLWIVFGQLFRGFEVPNYHVYALSGILFWNFVSQVITASMNSLRGHAALLTKLPVPKAVFPVATMLSGLLNLLFALVPLLGLMIVTGQPLPPTLAFVPVSMIVAAVFTLGVGLLLSPLAAFFSDTVELVGIVLTFVFYLTPVFYPASIVPENLRWLLDANPVRLILDVFRLPIYAGALPEASTFGLAVVVAVTALLVGAEVFRRTSSRIALYI
jgi:ABC-type polysaccharide/polyol phosphate export permease